uniref:Uncharacterized protein n=1 Tax=Glossina austeni TaxID=7395 RepID=A0A1A9VAB4_GLOAU
MLRGNCFIISYDKCFIVVFIVAITFSNKYELLARIVFIIFADRDWIKRINLNALLIMSEIGHNNYLSDSSPEDEERKRKADPVNYINEAILAKNISLEHNESLKASFIELFKEKMCFVKNNRTEFFKKSDFPTLSFLSEAVNDYEIDKFKIPFAKWKNIIEQMIEYISSLNIVFSKFERLSSDNNCMALIDTAYKYNKGSDIPSDVLTRINNKRLYNYLTADKSKYPRFADDVKAFIRNYEDNISREGEMLFESVHKFHIDRVKSLCNEQHAIIVQLFEMVFGPCSRSHKRMCNCYKFRTSVPIMRIEGKAGSGKTSIILVVSGLVQYSSKYSLTYLTPTNVLLNSIGERAGVDKINVFDT